MYSWLFLTDTEYIPLISLPAFYFLCKDQLRMTAFKNHKYNHASVLDHFSCILCSLQPHGLQPARPSVHGILQVPYWKNTRGGCHSLLQGLFGPRDRTLVFCIAGRPFAIWVSHQGNPESTGPSEWLPQNVSVEEPSRFILNDVDVPKGI